MNSLSKLFGLVTIAFFVWSPSAQAVCGKECRQAKKFCSNWEKSHPGDECGPVRGAICTGKSWKKIKQVNFAWSACRLVKGEKDLNAARARCKEFETNWRGSCQVFSPRCKAGWVKLGKYGKFRACRPIEVSANMRYNAYKAFMRKFEGKAKHKMHKRLRDIVEENYSFNPNNVRWGYASNTPSTCITDCDRIYCNDKNIIKWIRDPWPSDNVDIVFHELEHVAQCKARGGRKNFAKLWFGNLPKGFFGALNPSVKDKFKNKVHDAMPMEKHAESRADSVMSRYRKAWWHKKAYCRVYGNDKKSIVATSKKSHSRAYCDPVYKEAGSKWLKQQAKTAAQKQGYGRYYFAFGKPHENKGVWLGSEIFGKKPARSVRLMRN